MSGLGRNTFELEELNGAFWNSVILIYLDDIRVSFITLDKKEYYIGLENFPYALGDFADLLMMENGAYKAESQGWTYMGDLNALVRNEYLEAFDEVDTDTDISPYMTVLKTAGKMFGSDSIPEQTVWHDNVLLWNERKASGYFADLLEAKKLTTEDLDWHPLYPNNIKGNGEEGLYAMVFKESYGKIKGCKFTIKYVFGSGEGDITGYELWTNHYSDVLGPLRQPEYGMRARSVLGEDSFFGDCTFHETEVNDAGWSSISFKTMEEAKVYAVHMAEINGYNKETIITDLDNVRRECERWLKHYEAISEFQDRYKEIMKVVYDFEYPDESSYGGGFIIRALEEQLGIPEERAELMLRHIPMILTKREQRKAHENLAKCRELLEN